MEKTIEGFKAGQATPLEYPSSSVTPGNSVPTPASTVADVGGSQNVERSSREGLLFNKGTSSHYVNEVLFSRAIEQEDDVRMALTTPRDEPPHDVNSPTCHLNPMGWLSAGISSVSTAMYHPQRRVANRLWKVFIDSVDPYAKVLHIPTAETIVYTVTSDPTKASNENLALCFAIYYASVTALPPDEVLNITGEDNKQALLRMTIRTARLILCKVGLVSRRQWQIFRSPDDRQIPMATESEVTEAVELLELSNGLWQDDDLVPFQWLARAFPQYHIMLFILRHLCVCPRGDLAKRAFAAVDMHLENFKTARNGPLNGLKWTVLTTLRERAALLMQKVERESVEVERNRQMGFQGSGEGMQSGKDVDVAVPDWNMILEEFPLDMEDFSLIF
ncbi:hypothetical protein IL306_012242 [Fusarium sp. DS 682]|nr:hypothetical protein IL306_012242 [Fusarium sp. DS 682]